MADNFDVFVDRLYAQSIDKNLISAAFHMVTITLLSMSLADVQWFVVTGETCTPYLTLSVFFSLKYGDTGYECIDDDVINLMRIILMLCFMGIGFSLCGFFLHVVGTRTKTYDFIRRRALMSTCSVLWILSIISTCYYVAVLLQDSMASRAADPSIKISYGYGFYIITAAGSVSVLGTFWTIITMQSFAGDDDRTDDTCLIDDYNECLDAFNTEAPPPPYSAPPPPYAP